MILLINRNLRIHVYANAPTAKYSAPLQLVPFTKPNSCLRLNKLNDTLTIFKTGTQFPLLNTSGRSIQY